MELKNIHQTHSIIGVLSFWYGECALVGKKFSDKHDIPHYCWLWGQDAKKENRYPSTVEMKANELVVLSDFLQLEFEKNHGITPQYVVPPGVDPKEFVTPSPIKDIDLVAAGSLIPLKRYDLFIEIIAAIKKYIPGIKAVLVGDGPEKNSLISMISDKELQSNITLHGEMAHNDLLHLMQRSKIFLHTSSFEGFGIVCIEALYAGCDVISFVRPMKQDIDNWHFVNTKEEMAQKTLQLLQAGKTNFENIMPFHIEQTATAILELFK
jgi:glycosyltransferase involved in cell wall biosynthesis